MSDARRTEGIDARGEMIRLLTALRPDAGVERAPRLADVVRAELFASTRRSRHGTGVAVERGKARPKSVDGGKHVCGG